MKGKKRRPLEPAPDPRFREALPFERPTAIRIQGWSETSAEPASCTRAGIACARVALRPPDYGEDKTPPMTKTLGVRHKIGSRTSQGLNRRLAIRSEAVRWCSAASGTPASHAAPAWISLVCDTVRQAQSVPAPRARCFFQGQPPLATPPRQWRSLQLARRLCPTSKAFPAYQASVHSIASAQEARRAPALAGATPHQAGKRPQRFPDAVCTRRET